MTTHYPKNLGEQFLNEIWKERLSGVPPVHWGKEITPQQVNYLLNHYPYLRIINSNPQFAKAYPVKFIPAASGWTIHDYGDAMSASLGELLYGDYRDPRPEEEGGEGGSEGGTPLARKGTVIHQAIITADEMVILAMEKEWAGIVIVEGTPMMQWAAWLTATDYDFPLSGYTPSKADYEKRRRLEKMYRRDQEETAARRRMSR